MHILIQANPFPLLCFHMAISKARQGIQPKQIKTQSNSTGDDNLQ